MIPLFGVPFLERTISRLKAAGVKEAILAAGYLPRAITDHLGDGTRLGMKLTYVIENQPLGTAGALKNVEEHISGPFFVLNGDVLTSLDLRAMRAFHEAKGGTATLHLIRVEDPSAFGCVVHDASGRITSFVEKPRREEAPTNEINAGTYLLDPSVLSLIPAARAVSIERETFPALIAAGRSLYAHTTADYWLDIGRPEHYLAAHCDVLDEKLQLDPLADPQAHRGRMWLRGDSNIPPGVRAPAFIGAGVDLASGATIGPYAVVGEGVRVGAEASVSSSVVWSGAIIGAGARVEGAILASNVVVGRGARVHSGSVVGHDVAIEADAIIPADSRIVTEAAITKT
jgi:mannose-1-phosphate guanylyltransferase